MKNTIGIIANENDQESEQLVRSALRDQYEDILVFRLPGTNTTPFVDQFRVFEVATVEEARQSLNRERGTRELLGIPEIDSENDKTKPIRVGLILHGLAFGGISRLVLNMMEASSGLGIEWAGIGIANLHHLDSEVAQQIRRYCPIYSNDVYHTNPELTECVDNPFQAVTDRCDVIYLTCFIDPDPLFAETDFQNKPVIVTAHGQCEFTRRQIQTALQNGGQKICLAVSQASVSCYPEALRDQVHVIYNGLNVSRCTPTRRSGDDTSCLGPG